MTNPTEDALRKYSVTSVVAEGISHNVYVQRSGSAVVILHELPGLNHGAVMLADRLFAAGYTTYLPCLFGRPGRTVESAIALCVRREITYLSSRRESRITPWLRALCQHAHDQCGGPGIGVIGMCLTGRFAIVLAGHPSVLAPVSCQPATPLPALTHARQRALGITDAELDAAALRSREKGLPVLGFRFSHDGLCPAPRFVAIHEALPSFDATTIDSGPGNRYDIRRTAHAVLTDDFVDEVGHPTRDALRRVVAFFDRQLR